MKLSKYNIIFDIEDKKFAFNSMSCAFAEVDEEFFNIINNLDKIDEKASENENSKLIEEMKAGNFIVTDDFDEIKNLEYIFNSSKYNEKALALTIAPTLQCNFKCIYCYENPKHGNMDIKTQNAIIEKVKRSAEQKKNIETCWYGGEPLLALDVIYNLSEKIINICKENNVSHHASLVTNGYLLTKEIIEKLAEFNVSFIQVTLDGPPEIHDNRRILKGNGNGTFDKIIENLILLKNYKITTAIRINIDKTNNDSTERLMNILKDNKLDKMPVSFGHVMDFTDACKSISGNCLPGKEFSEICFDLSFKFIENNFITIGRKIYPAVVDKFCGANYASSFVIDPDGNIYKCWNEIGYLEKSIGNINEPGKLDDKMIINNVKYMTWSPFDFKECLECVYVPICMGGCSYLGMKSKKPFCADWKYQIEKYLAKTYEKNKNNDVKEESMVFENNCI